MGVVIQFPRPVAGQFTPEMRSTLTRYAAAAPGALPLAFGKNHDRTEFCRFSNGLMISLDRTGSLVLTDTATGYVDRGPFDSVDEICLVIAYIAA